MITLRPKVEKAVQRAPLSPSTLGLAVYQTKDEVVIRFQTRSPWCSLAPHIVDAIGQTHHKQQLTVLR